MTDPRETILLIGANPGATEVLRRLLALMNYRPLVVQNVEAALRTAADFAPDLVMVDVGLLGMGTLQLLKSLQETANPPPVIALASHRQQPIMAQVLQLNVRGCLYEPFTETGLREALDAALCERRLLSERETMDERLLVAEAVQTTAVTLSHYLNNYLTALNGGLQLAAEVLRQGQPNRELLQLLDESRRSSANIEAVMRVLVQASNAQLASYSGSTRMLDIEVAVKRELENLRADP